MTPQLLQYRRYYLASIIGKAPPLDWRETAPGLLYEADGDGGRRYVIASVGEKWTLDLLRDTEYEAEQQVDPQPAGTLQDAKELAQDLEAELW